MSWTGETISATSFGFYSNAVGSAEFDASLSGEQIPLTLKLQHLEKWFNMTQASVRSVVAQGPGGQNAWPNEEENEPPTSNLDVGVCDGHVYRLVLEGPWKDPFYTCGGETAPSLLDVAIEHCVSTRHLFRHIAEAADEGAREKTTDRGTRNFVCCADIVRGIRAMKQAERDKQTARKP